MLRPSARLTILAALALAACGTSFNVDPDFRTPGQKLGQQSIFGGDGLTLGGPSRRGSGEGENGLGVNSFLWRASLDTVAFMPIASADPFGGVILTDWYSPPENPAERFKLNVFILDRQLRADGLKVAVFRQERDAAGGWIDAPATPEMGKTLEDTILTRARELRVAQADTAQ